MFAGPGRASTRPDPGGGDARSPALPYWRLSGYYFFYFAFVGAFAPYWSLYLQHLGMAPFEIGVLMSLLTAARIVAPNLWGWLADHLGQRVMIVRLSALAGLVAYVGVFFGDSFAWLFLVMITMSFFWSASLPLVEATTLSHLGENTSTYGRIRLWGSVGFIAAVVGVGYGLDLAPVTILPWVVLAMMAGIALLARHIPEARALPELHAQADSAWSLLRRPPVAALFAGCFLMAAAHGAYYTFYSIYLVDHGYTKGAVGWLWGIGVVCEIAVFIWMPRLTARFGLLRILLASFAIAVVRFLIIGWGVEWIALLVLAQVLHAATFGSYHASAVALVHEFFRGRHQAQGQALYTSLSFGAGGTVGSLYSGYTWGALGPGWTLSIAAGCALLGFTLVGRYLRDPMAGGSAARREA